MTHLRRPFGEPEEDPPPALTFPEAGGLRTWVTQRAPVHEIRMISGENGGVTRLLERVRDDIGGGPSNGRPDDWIVAVMDLVKHRPVASMLIDVRNQVMSGADDLIGLHVLQRHFLAFDLVVHAWWVRDHRPIGTMPKLHATNIQRLAKVAANIGIATALGLALGATPVTEALKEAPGAEWVRERLTSVAVSLCTDMLRHAAGGLLIGELGKGEKADPDVLLSALPELLVAGINAIFVGPGSRSGPATRTGKPMRLLLIVDGIDAAHTVGPPSLRRLEPVVTLVCKVANPDQSRVLLGGRHAMPRLAVALARPIIHDAVSRFERSSVTAILGKTPLPADRREAIVAALCPETADTTPAKALHAAWTHRQELPPAALAEDLTRLARCLGPGVHSDKKLTRAAERSFGRVRTRDLLTELGRQPYVWIWKDGEAWRVSGLIA